MTRGNRNHCFNDVVSKKCHYWYCTKCGLIKTKSKATKKVVRKACPGSDIEVK